MTHPDFQLPTQDCEHDHGIDGDDFPELSGVDYSDGQLEPAKVTELTSEQITQLRMALQYYTAFANEAMSSLLNVFEYGCGVTVRNCNAQTQYEIDNCDTKDCAGALMMPCSWPGCTCKAETGESYCKGCLKVTRL